MKRLYLDCNILIDWLLDREPFSYYSAKLIELIEHKKITGIVSPLTIANTYYIISKEINKRIADEFVKDCIKIFSIVSISGENIKDAIENKYEDFEDDLHSSIIENNKIEYLITRNKKDFNLKRVNILNAEEFINNY